MVDARTIGDDPEELREIAEKTTVFGRVSPEQKRALVQALQRNGHVVAMTGDGVNDALALKDADIGVAMGNGAQATKAVAQLVLLDGRFSHMPSVLAEGRRVIGNVERVANLFVVEERDEPGRDHLGGAVHPAVPVPAPAPDPGLGGDDRHPGVLPGARARTSAATSPGSCRRVLRFAVPAGVVAGVVVLVSYLLARNAVGAPPASECLVQTEIEQIRWPTSSAGSRRPRRRSRCCSPRSGSWWCSPGPFRLWKAVLVGSMVAIAALAFITPLGQSFFNFSLTPTTCGSRWWWARSARSASRSSTAPNPGCAPRQRT